MENHYICTHERAFCVLYFKKTVLMKKLKKSTKLAIALLIYVTATAAYFLPRNTEISTTEKYVTVAVSYVIILVLWLVLRKKEELQRRRREEDEKR